MKTGIITCALTALALSAGITSHAQTVSDKKAKRQKEEVVNVRVWLNKGEDKVIDGYLRSALVNRPDNIEISLTADGKRMRYVNEDVDSLLLDGSDKYVKRLVKMYGALGGPAKVEWVREEYRGKGIDLYSLFTVEAERTGRNITVVRPVRSWYLSIAGDMAIMVGSDTRNSIFDKAEPSMSGSMLNKYFGKIYDYRNLPQGYGRANSARSWMSSMRGKPLTEALLSAWMGSSRTGRSVSREESPLPTPIRTWTGSVPNLR